ncbi:MAG: hypothetical protein Q7R33_05040 [Nitrosarchaeum sp.]|nr:hypothetical protein [Nitrosarchaeum sp.]
MLSENLQPLRERQDYAENGSDQLERAFSHLPEKLKDDVRHQFVRRTSMENIEKIAEQVLANEEKEAVSPPGWKGSVEAMKQHKEITNPWALAHWMAKQRPGAKWGPGGTLSKRPKPHYKEKKSSDERITEIIEDIIEPVMMPTMNITESQSKYSTTDVLKTSDGGSLKITTNYDEKNGETLLEEYVVERDGKVDKYDNVDTFTRRLQAEGLMHNVI